MNHVGVASAVLTILACLAAATGCSATAATWAMPAEGHGLPTVLGPLAGSGAKTFTVTIQSAMSVELGCLGNSQDLAWTSGPLGGFAVPCGSSASQPFGGSYDSSQDLERDKLRPGQRVTVRVAAPAGDTWQLWITGGPITTAKPVSLAS